MTCVIDGCQRPSRSKSATMCEMHYYRVRRNGHPGLKAREEYKKPIRRPVSRKAPHTCTVYGCSKTAKSNVEGEQVCLMHYKRWKRTGSMSLAASQAAREADRQALVEEMKRLYESGMSTTEVGTAVNRDASHVSRMLRDAGVSMRPRHPARRGDITYGAAHMRVRSDRGSARDHVCRCGAQSAQWSYTHQDPNEMQSDLGPYSPDPAFYVALCVPCHKRDDLARIKEKR